MDYYQGREAAEEEEKGSREAWCAAYVAVVGVGVAAEKQRSRALLLAS